MIVELLGAGVTINYELCAQIVDPLFISDDKLSVHFVDKL